VADLSLTVAIVLVSRAIREEKMDLLNWIFLGVENFPLLESRKVSPRT
jgi:hypothetical protein